jgi:hypothetical protein
MLLTHKGPLKGRVFIEGDLAGITYSISHSIETTTFHGFLQHDSSMLLTHKGLFPEGKGFYRG